MTVNAYDLSREQLTDALTAMGEPAYRARQIYDGLWRRAAIYDEMTDLPAPLRARLGQELPPMLEVVEERSAERGSTIKALLRVGGGPVVEAVVMGYRNRTTVCISSQAGCAMACGFCATGQMGLEGNLSTGEIAAQVVWAQRAARRLPEWAPRRVSRVVFMGMGEPMANYRAVAAAITTLTDRAGMDLGSRHVTVSTVGLVPGIRRLAVDHPQVGLAVSLHAASDELRDTLVPVNRRWPLAAVEEAVGEWRQGTRRRPSIEWAMIHGVNDGTEQAVLLAPLARRLHAHVNLIPLNPTAGSADRASSPGRIAAFVEVLQQAGVVVTVRDTRGRGIEAACGQLRTAASSLTVTPRRGPASSGPRESGRRAAQTG